MKRIGYIDVRRIFSADGQALSFGTDKDIGINWDGTRLNVTQLTADSEIRWGVDGAGIDQRWYGDDAGAYMQWDQTANRLNLNLVDKAATDVTGFHVVATLDGATGWYYGVQSDIHKSGTDGIDDMYALTGYIEILAGDFTTTGRVAPLCVLLSGTGVAGTITGEVYVAWIANRGTITSTDAIVCLHNQSSAVVTSGLLFDLYGVITNALEFNDTNNYVSSLDWNCQCATFDSDGAIKIDKDGTTYYIPFYTEAHTL